jgi:hypothetical protein
VSNPPGKTLAERIDVTEVEQAAGIVRSRPRVKGSKREQRSIRRVRTAFATLLENNAASYQAMFEKAADKDPMKALALMVSLAEYYMPKLGRIEQTGTVEHKVSHFVPVTEREEAPKQLTADDVTVVSTQAPSEAARRGPHT